MKTVINRTRRPLRIRLPQGKVLHLGPNREGQISDHALDHPGVKRLLEAKEIEIAGEGEHAESVRTDTGRGPESTHPRRQEEKRGRGDR